MKKVTEAIRQYVGDIRSTGGMLAAASKRFFLFLMTAAVVLAACISYFFMFLGEFLDALIGARGVGFVTSDMRQSGLLLLFLIVLLAGILLVASRLRGGARRWFFQVVEIVGVALLLVVALPSAFIRLPVQVVCTVVAMIYHKRVWNGVLMALIALAFFLNVPEVLAFTVKGDLTLGFFVTILSADLFITLWSLFKLSSYADYH